MTKDKCRILQDECVYKHFYLTGSAQPSRQFLLSGCCSNIEICMKASSILSEAERYKMKVTT